MTNIDLNRQLYELSLIREQETVLNRAGRRGGHRRTGRLVSGMTRRLRRRSMGS